MLRCLVSQAQEFASPLVRRDEFAVSVLSHVMLPFARLWVSDPAAIIVDPYVVTGATTQAALRLCSLYDLLSTYTAMYPVHTLCIENPGTYVMFCNIVWAAFSLESLEVRPRPP